TRALAGVVVYRELTAQFLHGRAHNRHANTASTRAVRSIACGKARRTNHIEQRFFCYDFGWTEQARGARTPRHYIEIDAPSIIDHFNTYSIALRGRAQNKRTFCPLACRCALLGSFESMTDSVAHEVQQRLEDAVHDELVDFRLIAEQLNRDQLAELTCKVA